MQWTKHLGVVTPFMLVEDEVVGKREQGGRMAKEMCPQGLALAHPAASLLKEWSQYGCPAMTGKDWTVEQMEAAIVRGPHESALCPEAIAHFQERRLKRKWRLVKHELSCGRRYGITHRAY